MNKTIVEYLDDYNIDFDKVKIIIGDGRIHLQSVELNSDGIPVEINCLFESLRENKEHIIRKTVKYFIEECGLSKINVIDKNLKFRKKKQKLTKVQLTSDGTPGNTKVFINGKEIIGVQYVSYSIGTDGHSKVTLELTGAEIVYEGFSSNTKSKNIS